MPVYHSVNATGPWYDKKPRHACQNCGKRLNRLLFSSKRLCKPRQFGTIELLPYKKIAEWRQTDKKKCLSIQIDEVLATIYIKIEP
ncbi:MAG: hypothetical protein JO002_01695 [Burkholderiaceae bacterium]|nr:hypothetical protein [Burkholderiaceae bacterium]